jgi:alkaline phosphatase
VLSPLGSADAALSQPRSERTAKNVIFINGDGMSAAHREAARLRFHGLNGKLQMDSLRWSGNLTTDSGIPAPS